MCHVIAYTYDLGLFGLIRKTGQPDKLISDKYLANQSFRTRNYKIGSLTHILIESKIDLRNGKLVINRLIIHSTIAIAMSSSSFIKPEVSGPGPSILLWPFSITSLEIGVTPPQGRTKHSHIFSIG
jgi:hypothetical protein